MVSTVYESRVRIIEWAGEAGTPTYSTQLNGED